MPAAVAAALARRDAVAADLPVRPTWIGDRFHTLSGRIRRAYALDLYAAWPRLWLAPIAWYRARATADILAGLVESAFDVHGRELAVGLGIGDAHP